MASKFLGVYQRNATYEIEQSLPTFWKTPADAEIASRICQLYRQRGIYSLLKKCRPDEFVRDLHYSARAFVFHLGAANEKQKVDSKSVPFFDALASRDQAAALAIARLGRGAWADGEEFEDDYCYFSYLWGKFCVRRSADDLAKTLGRYEAILNGDYDPRFEICRAIEAKDATAFETALADILSNHESRYKRLVEGDLVLPEEAVSEGKLCVEALGLINAVEPLGLVSEQDYVFVPSVAREQVSIDYETERWRTPSPPPLEP